jgi:hypothetical protein
VNAGIHPTAPNGLPARLPAETACRAAGIRALHLQVESDRRGAYGLELDANFVGHDRRLIRELLDDDAPNDS